MNSAHISNQGLVGTPTARALAAGGVALVVSVIVLAWALLTAPPGGAAMIGWAGGIAVLALTGLAGAAAYYWDLARQARTRVTEYEQHWLRWQAEAGRFEVTLRETAERLRKEAPLDDVRPPNDPVLHRVLGVFVEGCRACVQDGAEARRQLADLREDADRLVAEWLPEAAKRIRDGRTPLDTVRQELPEPSSPVLRPVLGAMVDAIADGERVSAATLNACRNAGARIQAANRKTLAMLDALLHKYEQDAVFGDLMTLDHEISMTGRMADSIVVLSGGRTGRRWTKPIAMESILRGALSRVRDYPRVRVQATVEGIAVSGHAAEGVMHALAELLDNATSFSPPPSAVAVYVEDVDAGALITIEDSGLGMRKRELERAQQTVSHPHDLASLPGTRLGLPVVGRLARKHDLEVHFRPSSRGGTGVVMMIPRHLLTELPDPEPEAAAEASAEVEQPSPKHAAAPPEPEVRPDGLPQRRRGATLEAELEAGAPVPGTLRDPAPSGNPTAKFAAFRRALGTPGAAADDTRGTGQHPYEDGGMGGEPHDGRTPE